ncbi:FAD-dependent oxidoreductase [Chloroflexota bacterium]
MSTFTALFQPGNIGSLSIKNRLVMPAMGTALVDEGGHVTENMIDYYRARARGGVGLIVTQLASVSADATVPYAFTIHEDRFIPGLNRLADAVHEDGAKIAVQVVHFGFLLSMAEDPLGSIPEDMSLKVPSITSWMPKKRAYEEVSADRIKEYVEDFAKAACRLKEAGIDAIEIHACHGCLLGTFLSPVTNRRTDQYGGSLENRTLFARQVLSKIKEKAGADYPITVRINCTDDVDGGITLDEAIRQSAILEAAGADAISVSAGFDYWSTLTVPCYRFHEGPTVPMAVQIKRAVGVPIMAAGKIGKDLAEQIVGDGRADFVAIGRPLLADPELPNKLREGRLEDIRSCLYCNNCMKLRTKGGACTVNPFLYRESRPLMPAKLQKKVMVIGGGLAGMQAAAIAGQRGHQVTLYEKGHELGGQWNTAASMPGKEGFSSFTDYLKRSLDKNGVQVITDTEVTRDQVQREKPDAVIVGTGAIPRAVDVSGAESSNVVQANDVIDGKAEVKGRVVVLGGRFLGMEMAIWLAEQGEEVSLVTRGKLGGQKGPEEGITYRTLLRRLVEMRVPMYLNTPVLEVMEDSVVIGLLHEPVSLPADTVVLAIGAEPDNKLARELDGVVPELHIIGDCVEPRDAAAATYEAARTASRM